MLEKDPLYVKVVGMLSFVESSVRMMNDHVACEVSSFACGGGEEGDVVEVLFGMYDPSVKM